MLLRNEGGVLPLDRARIRSLAVIGPMADSAKDTLGPWVFDQNKPRGVTVLEGLKAKLGPKVTIAYSEGVRMPKRVFPSPSGAADKQPDRPPLDETAEIARAAGLAREDLDAVDRNTGLSRPSIVLRDAITRANKIIYQTARSQAECEGMGTTVVAALFYDNRISIAHVGDSRLYRQRGSQISQVTMDHSLLQELVDRGFYSPEEAQRAANKNYVTRALGVEPQVEVEVQEHPVDKGDIFILCSDGLSDMVEDEDIRLTISTFGANLDTVAKQLIQLANENGGRDNVSVVLAQAVEAFPASRGVMDKLLGWFS